MHEEYIHITPDPKKGFPQPEIPADEAWNQMAEMLDNAMPVSPPEPPPPSPKPSPSAGGGIFGGGQFWAIVGGVIIIAGALTWGVVSLTDRPEKQDKANKTIAEAWQITPNDSLTSTHPENTNPTSINKTDEPIIKKDSEVKKAESKNVNEIKVQQEDVRQPGINAKTEKEPKQAVSGISGQAAEKTSVDVPSQSKSGNITTPAEDKTVEQQPVNEDVVKDTVLSAGSRPQPAAATADSVKPADNPGQGENPPVNPATNGQQDNAKKQPEPGKVKDSSGKSKNLSWQIGLTGNIGEVVQKGRDPNLFYGGMATGGLWHEKIKGGIETGLGYEIYEDYGSVTENIRVDSIPPDTLGNFQYLDSTRITAYKYHYQYLQVPLFISKQVLTKGKFSFDIKTGPVIGFMISERKTFDYMSGPENGEILSTVSNDYSRLKISWQWQVLAQLRWNFNERLSLSLSPYGIFYLNNLYDKKNRPANMPFGIGMYGGLIYSFK